MSGGWGLVTAAVLGLAIGEFSELSPWLAQKLVRWAAQVRYPTRVEELSALIAERPGKLFKLVTATGFVCAALTYRVTHRKTAPVHSATSQFWIGLDSALAAGILLNGELFLGRMIPNGIAADLILIMGGAIAAFITIAELLVSPRLPAGWATAVVGFALVLIVEGVRFAQVLSGEVAPGQLLTDGGLLALGGMVVAASVSAACAIRWGARLRFPVMAASSTIPGGSLLILGMTWGDSTRAPENIYFIVEALGHGFAFGCSVGFGVLLWHVLCGRRPSQSSSERESPTAT